MITRLARLVEVPSVSGAEGPLADLVQRELQQAGLAVRREGNNLWCEIGDTPRPRLLLNSHLDTVPPASGWSGDPWTPGITDDRLIGLGANDAKGCVAAMIEVALAAHRRLQSGRRLGGTLVLALTAEEETSGNGLGTIVDRLSPLDGAIVGEPTGLVPMVAQRGLLILRGIARGRSAHPANTPPDAGNNAILSAAHELTRLAGFDWGPAHPLLGRVHAHPTTIKGGLARNVVPDVCEFCLDIRTTPAESHAELVARLRRYMNCELEIHSDRLVPVETAAETAIVRAVLRALPEARPAGSPAMSDMVYLPPIPAVKIGPGDSRRSHTPDEHVRREELRRGAAAYARIVSEFFKEVGSGTDAASPEAELDLSERNTS